MKNNVKESKNKEIGILPPGPIYNDSFFKKDSEEMLTGLVLNTDYRGVNYEVWQLLKKMYGGGPLVVRDELDIYSNDVSEQYIDILSAMQFEKKENEVEPLHKSQPPQEIDELHESRNREKKDSSNRSHSVNMKNLSNMLFAKSGIINAIKKDKRRDS